MVTVEKYDRYEEVAEVWTKLWESNSNASIYQSPKYAKLVWEHIALYRMILRMKPVFYLFRENETPIMILPLLRKLLKKRFTLYGYKAGCGYVDAIYDDSMTTERLNECFRKLGEALPKWELYMSRVREETAFGHYLLSSGGVISDTPCSAIDLPEDYDTYYGSLSKSTRQNIRTSYNRLEKSEGVITLERFTPHDLPEEVRNELLSLYIARQKKRYHKFGGILFDLFVKRVDIGTYAEKDASGLTETYVLRIDGRVAAYFDALRHQDTLVIPRLAIDDSFQEFSPGVMLLNESIKSMIKGGNTRCVDLTHGAETYKKAMGGQLHYCVEGTIEL